MNTKETFIEYADIPEEFKPLENVYIGENNDTPKPMDCDFVVLSEVLENGNPLSHVVYFCRNNGDILEILEYKTKEQCKSSALEDIGTTEITWKPCNVQSSGENKIPRHQFA